MLDELDSHRGLVTVDSMADRLAEVLGFIEHRGQLERLIGNLPGSELVVERTEAFLLLTDPVPRGDDELGDFARAHIAEFVAAGRRDSGSNQELAGTFEALGDLPVVVADDEPGATGAELVGGSFVAPPTQDTPDGLLTAAQIANVLDHDAEWSSERVTVPTQWLGASIALRGAVTDRPGVGQWLLSPAVTSDFDFEPFFRLWESGASLWLSLIHI